MSQIQIINYSEAYQPDFKRLNVEWISQLFAIEEHDIEQLDHPEKYILKDNGAIFLAQVDGQIVGTVAMVNTGNNSYELAKMSVTPTRRRATGQGTCLLPAASGASWSWIGQNVV